LDTLVYNECRSLHKWSGIDQSQIGRDASQDNFQDYGPGRDLAGSGEPSQSKQPYQ